MSREGWVESSRRSASSFSGKIEENCLLRRYPKLVKNGKNGKNGRNFGGFFREKIVRGVGSSHRGYSIFFGKFFKKSRIFAGHNENFQKNPNFRPNLEQIMAHPPRFWVKNRLHFCTGVPTIS